jgi:mannose-6-phosphate isomerase-like protein (cupin superfamily)
MIVNKLWGYEIWIENNEKYCGKHLHIVPGKKCSVHYHKNKKETFYIISGKLLIEYSDHTDLYSWQNMLGIKTILLEKGDSFTIEPNTPHRFYTTASYACDFIEISSHHNDNDSYRIIESF